ncbi:hypothetical protein BST61_g11420 [Cercospora zeina]
MTSSSKPREAFLIVTGGFKTLLDGATGIAIVGSCAEAALGVDGDFGASGLGVPDFETASHGLNHYFWQPRFESGCL